MTPALRIDRMVTCAVYKTDGIMSYPSCVVSEEKRRLGRHVSTS